MPITFPGLVNICRGEAVLTRGVIPSVQVVLVLPQDNLELEPGQLSFSDGNGGVLNLPDCLPLLMSMRKVSLDGGWMWAIEFLDHRHRWWEGQTVSGEWNKRRADATVDPETEKTPAELAMMCLEALDEGTADVSEMPDTVRPYCDWRNNPPAALALKQVCDACVCEVCGGELQDVTVWPAGSGPDLPSGDQLHETMRMTRVAPGNFKVIGGRIKYASSGGFELDAVGFETDGTLRLIDDLSYRPTTGWEGELPGLFYGVANEAERDLAKKWVWRLYQVRVGPEIELLNEHPDLGTGPYGLSFPLRPKIKGQFYPYNETLTTTAITKEWLGGFDFDAPRQLVTFPLPVYMITSGGYDEPVIRLHCAYYDAFPNQPTLNHLEVEGAGSGNGGTLEIRLPWLFDSYASDDYQFPGFFFDDGTVEANAYIALYQAKYADNVLNDQSYAGIAEATLSGIVAEVVVMGSCLGDEGFTSRACRLEESAPLAPSEAERKRREIVGRIRRERGL